MYIIPKSLKVGRWLSETSYLMFFGCLVQGGPLRVINGVITPINGLMNGYITGVITPISGSSYTHTVTPPYNW